MLNSQEIIASKVRKNQMIRMMKYQSDHQTELECA